MVKQYENYSKEQLLEKIKHLEKHRYGLVWENKLEDVAEQCELLLPVLHEEKSKEIYYDEKKLNHVLIEGDNFHVLYTLNFTHKRKVDLIYIDPPYNTGKAKEWKYNDRYVDSNDTYRHSKWISFMNKRLQLAKNLLRDEGVIFISIDDNEVCQLKLLCDRIFGQENNLQLIVWQRHAGGGQDSKHFAIDHEYILAYAKSKINLGKLRVPLSKKDIEKYKDKDEHFEKLGYYKTKSFKRMRPDDPRPGLQYTIIAPDGIKISDEWKWEENKFKKAYKGNKVLIRKDKKNNWVVEYKLYLKSGEIDEEDREKVPRSLLADVERNSDGKKQLREIFNGEVPFNNPKPTELIQYFLQLHPNRNATILDFFAGSGTTGQAVLELNQQDGGNRQFILCTNNENNICEEVTYPRIRKVIKGYNGNRGIAANLKYFKTDFVPQVITDNDKRVLVNRSTELLCLAENTFELVKKSKGKNEFAIYKNSKQFCAIIYDEDAIEKCKKELERLKPKVKTIIYVFSYDHEYNVEDFEDLKIRFSVKPIPEAILNVYRKNAKLKRK